MTLYMFHLSKILQTSSRRCWHNWKFVSFSCRRNCAQSRQGIEKDRGNIYEVMNEIGSLLELVVKYAREHEPTSEKFVGTCNDFLR